MQKGDSSQQRGKTKHREDKEQSTIRLLFLTSNPPHQYQAQEQLRIEQEMRGITSAISNNFDLRKEGAVRMQDLSRHLLRHQPVLLHFSGHGTEEGELVLEKYGSLTGQADVDYIEYAAIARILAEYRATLRCVVLNASHTEPLAEAICAEIPCAIGMRGPINDFLAIRFAEIFYRSLTMGESVGLAFRKARSDVLSNPNARAETFQLKSKVGVNPDNISFIPPIQGRAGILLLRSSPPHQYQAQERLRIEQEMREIKYAISESRRFFDLHEENGVRLQDFSRHLLRYRPVLLHFSGRAADEGELVLEKYASLDALYSGGMHLITGEDFIDFPTIAGMLAEYRETLRCVVLNASYTEPLAEAICKHIDCAIGLRGYVNDWLAIRFSSVFYQALAYGESVGLAFRKARSDVLRPHPQITSIE